MAAVPAGAPRRSASKLFIVGLVILIVGVVAAIIVSQLLYSVTQSESAIVQQFGQVRSVESTPGLHLKIPFVQQVTYLDRGSRISDTNAVEYLTSNQERILVRATTRWRIVDPQSFSLALNNEGVGNARLARLVVEGLRQRIAATPYNVMISAERDAIMNQVRDALQAQANEAGWGIEVIEISAEVSPPR